MDVTRFSTAPLVAKPGAAHPDGGSRLPELLRALDAAGYDFTSITTIAYDNWMRIFSDSW